MKRKTKKRPRGDTALEKLRECVAEIAKRPCEHTCPCPNWTKYTLDWCWPCFCRALLLRRKLP